MDFVKKHKKLCTVLAIVVAVAVVGGVWGYSVYLRVAGPDFQKATAAQMQDPRLPAGAQTAEVGYLSEVLMMNAPSGTSSYNTITAGWDDSWFSKPSTEFNYDLANFCIAASAMANGESMSHTGELGFDICEQTLSTLGFTDIDTASYDDSSYVSDEIDHVFENSTDDAAFVMARKTLAAADGGQPQELVLLAIRGTYGTEWLSNFKVELHNGAPIDDHAGYLITSDFVLKALRAYYADHGIDASNAKLLLAGHSRGASVAGTVAALVLDLLDVGSNAFAASPESVYAYCFATSPNTKNAKAHDARYAGIFNILDPTDIVPMLPLAEWGFTYWGRVGMLPGPDATGFTGLYSAMNKVRAGNTGYTCVEPYKEGDANMAASLRDKVARIAPAAEGIEDSTRITLILEEMTDYDMVHILGSHYPDTYIAWLQTLEAASIVWQ